MYKLSGNRRKPWIARVTIGYEQQYDENENPKKPKQLYKTIGYFRTRKEGIIALAKYNDDPDYYNVKKTSPTFEELFEILLNEYERKGLEDDTIKTYKTAFNRLSSLNDMPIDKISIKDCQNIFNEMQDNNLSKKSMYLTKNVINSIFKLAMKNDYIVKNPTEFISINSNVSMRIKKPFTPQEIELVYKNLSKDRLAPTVLIMLFTGMRVGELLSLKKEDIHLKERYMVGGSKTNAGKNRIIPIHKFIYPYIEKYYTDEKNKSIYLIPSSRNTMIDYSNYSHNFFVPFMNHLKMEHTPHECRHTFISMTSGRQFDQTRIKRIVGHKTNDITIDIYTHFYIEELIEEIDKLEVPFQI